MLLKMSFESKSSVSSIHFPIGPPKQQKDLDLTRNNLGQNDICKTIFENDFFFLRSVTMTSLEVYDLFLDCHKKLWSCLG